MPPQSQVVIAFPLAALKNSLPMGCGIGVRKYFPLRFPERRSPVHDSIPPGSDPDTPSPGSDWCRSFVPRRFFSAVAEGCCAVGLISLQIIISCPANNLSE